MSAILILDDHPLYRVGVASMVRGWTPEATVLEAGTVDAALDLLERNPEIELVLVDLRLDGDDGFRALELMRGRFPAVARLAISGSNLPDAVGRARRLGAAGFFPKQLGVNELRAAVERILAGGTYFPDAASSGNSANDAREPANQFSLRQMEVLLLLARGDPNKRIATELGITERTVKWHIAEIMQRLGAHNRTQALVEAERRGLLPYR